MTERLPLFTPARWPALLLLSVLGLSGCSMLPPSLGGPKDKAPDVSGVPDDAPLAFTLDVRAPEDIDEYLTKNLELQRFRRFPGLEARELSRLLGAADDNARELLATLGYFSPTLTLEMKETPEAEAPRTIELTVEPGPQTLISDAKIAVTGPDSGPSAESAEGAPQRARVQNQWALAPGQPWQQGLAAPWVRVVPARS